MGKETTKPANLRPKEARFVEEYLVDGNGTRAAKAAGYGAKSDAAAAVTASRLLKRSKIAVALEKARAAQSERTQLRADDVLLELRRLALLDVAQAYDASGALKPLDQIPEDVRRCIQGIDISKTGERVAKFAGKEGPLVALARHFGLLRDKMEASGEGGSALTIEVRTYKGGT